MKVHVFKSKEMIDQEVATLIVSKINAKPNFVIGLATGSTPLGIYQELISLYQQNKVSFKDVTSFNLDEYVGLEKMHPQSYRYYMNHHLFSKTDFNVENTFFPGETSENYDLLIASKGGIDLQILGIGGNGHIAFNEPGTSFDALTHETLLAHQTRLDNSRFFNSLEEVPTKALTMGLGSIMCAKEIILVATGLNKAEAVKSMIEGDINVNCPASILQNHINVHIYLDEDAASLLEGN
ncbi:TPA: glucosamine-6-phosphate deaminase [bacterium]|nr:glucosamine-6-phosphate deaminase [bacterium]